MINARELRIGNILELDEEIYLKFPDGEKTVVHPKGEILKVTAISENEIICHGVNTKPEYLNYIPLTPDLLERFGFENNNGTFRLQNKQNGIWFALNYKFEFELHTQVSIKYVHQLQNLFFALTGTELELKRKMKLYVEKLICTRELFEQSIITDSTIYAELKKMLIIKTKALDLVGIKFTKIDPLSIEPDSKTSFFESKEYIKSYILHLRDTNTIHFEAEVYN